MSISILNGTLGEVRICRQAIWTPAHTRTETGKDIQEKISFPVMANDKNGRKDTFRLTAWGGYARTIALCGSVGMALTVNVTPQSYLGRLYDQNDNLIMRPDGQPMLVDKTVFRIDLLSLGLESAKFLAEQIAKGKRPQYWNVPGHADKAIWDDIAAKRRAHRWTPGETEFGFARVELPGYQHILKLGEDAAPGSGAIVQPGPASSTEQAVQQVANSLPAQAPVQAPAQPYQQMSGQQLF